MITRFMVAIWCGIGHSPRPRDQHNIRSPNVGLGLQAVQEYLKSSEFTAYIQCNGRTDDRIPHTPAC
jgi:predicted transcriptional regulator